MADHSSPAQPQTEDEGGSVPVMQQLLDNPFLLLFLGVLFPPCSTSCGASWKS